MKSQMILKLAAIAMPLVLSACNHIAADKALNAATSPTDGSSSLGRVSVIVKDSSGNVVYTDANPNSSLNLVAGLNYQLILDTSGAPAGSVYSLEYTNIGVVASPKVVKALAAGSNAISLPAAGDYSLKVIISSQGSPDVSQSYQAAVACANPSFNADSLDASKISVTGNTNVYSYSAAGVTANANGMAPYKCAWDPTGVGIIDSDFISCDQAFSAYVNYVGVRKVGLIVKDSCNIPVTISKSLNLLYTEPSMPGNVFIYGVLSGLAATPDPRIDSVEYLATNVAGNNIVQPSYGGGTFTISAFKSYGMPSSVKFGMQIKVKGIVDNLNPVDGSGTIDASNAFISQISYVTDQAGDQAPTVTLTGSSCVLSNQGAKAMPTAGTPCSAGQSGTNNMISVEVWGHYVCTNVKNADRSVTITGDFDGTYNLVDACVGGGGGGGGIVPIQF